MTTLRAAGYPAFAVMRLVTDARWLAERDVVAAKMSKP
jgi:hypothetical protein